MSKHDFRPLLTVLLMICASGVSANVPIPAAPSIAAEGFFLIEAYSERVIASKNADERLEPASLTKLMTAYVVFKELKQGKIELEDTVQVSEKAWRTQGSRMFIEVGTSVTVEELLQGMIIQSGNDASVALAEHVAGTEETFAAMMNQYATQLEFADTRFQNSTGLPLENHYTTARDVAVLARALIAEFPEYYRWYSQKDFSYNGIKQENRNTLLWRDPSVDGVKTGHTEAAGFCLVSSARRNGMRLISVVMGTPSAGARADASQALLNYGFRFYETHRLYPAGEEVARGRVWKGQTEDVALGLQQDMFVTIPRGQYDNLQAVMEKRQPIVAPLTAGKELGEVRVTIGNEILARGSLHALSAVPQDNFFGRLIDEVLLWFE